MATDEFLKTLIETGPVTEVFVTGLASILDDGTARLVGWTEMPSSFTPEDDQPTERVLALRVVMSIEAFRDFIARAKHNLER